MKRLFYYIEDN